MTVIAVARNKSCWAMAADSGAFELSLKYTVKTPKIWRVDDALIGVSGSFRIMNAVRESGIDRKSTRLNSSH